VGNLLGLALARLEGDKELPLGHRVSFAPWNQCSRHRVHQLGPKGPVEQDERPVFRVLSGAHNTACSDGRDPIDDGRIPDARLGPKVPRPEDGWHSRMRGGFDTMLRGHVNTTN
jgi:hypothetical protein